MRLIDADELLEHAYRDRLDSRELIADMIRNAPTIKKIPCNIPIEIVGCMGCAFTDYNEWDLPCRVCKRNSKDYWRPKYD